MANTAAAETIDLGHASLAQRIYDRLLAEIMSGAWLPGQPITTKAQAERFNVSPTPVREALLRLANEGALRLAPRSFTIPRLTRDQFVEIRKLRSALESLVTREAVSGPAPVLAAQLETIHRRLMTAKERRRYDAVMELNREFHFTLYEAAGMPQALEMIKLLWARSGPYQYTLYADEQLPDPALHDHLRVIEAVRDGSAARAARAVVDDIALRGVRIEDALAALA